MKSARKAGEKETKECAGGADGCIVLPRVRGTIPDMGEADTYKQVLQVAAGVTAVGAVTPTYVTERGQWAGRPVYPADDGLLRLSPVLSRCRRFALKLTGDNLCVDGIAVQLRGGMR